MIPQLTGAALSVLALASADVDGDEVQEAARLRPIDVFELEYAADPQISPDGKSVVYVRRFMDVMTDRSRSNLWIVRDRGEDHRPITTGNSNDASPRWSPDGDRLAYVSTADGSAQLWVRWLDTGQSAKVTNLTESPGNLAWSPDGEWLAFTMRVPEKVEPFAKMPPAPEGAEWAPAAKVIDSLLYRSDGGGYLEAGYTHAFVVPADGGSPRRLTDGKCDHGGSLSWTPDGEAILLSTNRREDRDYEPNDSEIFEVSLTGGEPRQLTRRYGPDHSPAVSPDGTKVAYLGHDETFQGYQRTRLYVMERDGSNAECLTEMFDASLQSPVWDPDGTGVYAQYAIQGRGKVGLFGLDGTYRPVVEDLGGTSLGRPYSGGSFSVSTAGRDVGRPLAFTLSRPDRPADVGVVGNAGVARAWTRLNEDLLGHKQLGNVEELWCTSSYDERRIQSWVVTPPGFDPGQKYPMILEIHGGPFANYGPRFAAEVQLYAAAGYVVLYSNPRGSTSYGEEFGNLIHHDYPGKDYFDLMSAVDALLDKGFVDPGRLYVTGGSGGGVLTAWIVGKTDRFQAAVVAKPVIHWTSFVLTADAYNFFYRYWFPGPPWEHIEQYWARSPLSLVGNVTTPTMLLTGEADYRTPISESEQYYQALKLRKVDAAFVRIPEASHGIAARPSNLIAKVLHVLEWFERHK